MMRSDETPDCGDDTTDRTDTANCNDTADHDDTVDRNDTADRGDTVDRNDTADRGDTVDHDEADEFESAEPVQDEFEPAEPIDADEPADTGDSAPRTDDDRLTIPLETIAVLNWLGDIGVDGVESRLDQVLADDLTVETEQVRIDHAESEEILTRFGAEDRAGARVPLRKPFAGNLLVLFPVKSANRAASLMLERAVDDVESVVSTEMGRDALTELCNMMANGFVDEWATAFDTPFDTGAPVAVQNPEMTLLHRIFSASELGLYLTARLHIGEHDIDAIVFVFPSEAAFVTKIPQVGPEVIDR
jgi:chemotaxis protein CheC